MDQRFRGKKLWIGLGALAIVFLCLMLCGLGAMAMVTTSRGPVVQPPAGEEGAAPPPTHYGHGPLGMGRSVGWGPFGILSFGLGLLFKLLFFGLLLLLLIGLAKRLFWGHRAWCPPYWGQPPEGKEGEDKPYAAWGPWAWAWYQCKHWGPPPWRGSEPEPSDEEGEPDQPCSAEE